MTFNLIQPGFGPQCPVENAYIEAFSTFNVVLFIGNFEQL